MLGKTTIKWLETRENRLKKFGCYIWPYDFPGRSIYSMIDIRDFEDAGMFEARVAEKLTSAVGPEPCGDDINRCPHKEIVLKGNNICRFCRLKYARIQVEEDIENAGQKHN